MASKDSLAQVGEDGAFQRTESALRAWIKKGGEHPPEANRYHLYVCLACPWASRCVAGIYLKGLQDIIGISVTHPTWARTRPDDDSDQHCGWQFADPSDPPVSSSAGYGSFPPKDCVPDTVNGTKFVRDLYELSGHGDLDKFTVPVLWDKTTKTIVNNESSEILRMLNTEFNEWSSVPELDLYPEALRSSIDAVNEWIYPSINNGVYRCGFAKSQEAYEKAFDELFGALDRCESILEKSRYIAGDTFTEADVRLFVTLIRFDPVYVVYFKCNKAFIRDYPNIREYVKEVYAMPGIKSSVNIGHIKMHYFTSHPVLNAYSIIPKGAESDSTPWWEQPHNRDERFPA